MRVGLIVNPIAGMGGSVGLKGTDGAGMAEEALRRGASPQAGPRTCRAMELFARRAPGTTVFAAAGQLGAAWLRELDLDLRLVEFGSETGSARDTQAAAAAMADCDIVVFAGGDGTARDVAGSLPNGTPMLGIPCGVKMHSGVFALTPEAAGALLADVCLFPHNTRWRQDAEIVDIDEAALRAGHLAPQLYGVATVPAANNRMQAAKGGPRTDPDQALEAAAAEVAASMEPGSLYLIGPGTSAGAVARAAGHEPTLLGVDALCDGRMVARDASAAELEAAAQDRRVRIVLGVTGRQGFLLGRGNQQIGPKLIASAGREGLIVLASPDKLAALAPPILWIDTGDPALDASLCGFVRVRTGWRRETMMRIASPD